MELAMIKIAMVIKQNQIQLKGIEYNWIKSSNQILKEMPIILIG